MEAITKQTRLAVVERSGGATEVSEGLRFLHNFWLTELPGAAFAAMTLIYVVSSLMRL